MRLSTRFALATIALVVLTATVIGILNYRVFEAAGMPAAVDRFEMQTRQLTVGLEAATAGLRTDLLALRVTPSVQSLARVGDAADAQRRDALVPARAALAAQCAALLAAEPVFRLCAFIAADGRRELVHVERSGPAATVRVAADGELQQWPADELFAGALARRDGEVVVAPVGADVEPAGAGAARIPVLRAAVPVAAPDHAPVGVLLLGLDLRPAFAPVRAAAHPDRPFYLAALPLRSVFVIDEGGRYLVHPDPARELAFVGGDQVRLKDDFPGLAHAAVGGDFGPHVVRDRSGTRFVAGLGAARLAGGPLVTVILAIPYDSLFAANRAALHASLIGGLAAVLCAVALAIVVTRSMSRPLVQMTDAVAAFARGEPVAVPRSAGGEIGVLATAFDRMAEQVSEQTAALRRSAEIFDLIMTRMADAVIVIDATTAIVFANDAARRFLGPQAVAGWKGWADYLAFRADGVTPLTADERPIPRTLRGESIDNFHLAFRPRDGERLVHIITSGRPIEAAGGERQGAVLVFRDVTAWTEAERLLRDAQKMDAIGQLTGGIAHDFNNLLTVITGTIDALVEGVADRPKLAAIVRVIDQAATRGAMLTRQLLAFARRQPLRPQLTDVNGLILETEQLLRSTLGEQVDIELSLAAGLRPVMIDPAQLSTALLNLALNARDAMTSGGILTLATANVAEPGIGDGRPGPWVRISVTDTGSGIPAAIRDKVFEPFFTTKEVGKGTGLGLSMVYGFVRQSGGHVTISSEESSHTTVELYLPCAGDVGSRDTTPAQERASGTRTAAPAAAPVS
jgi:signal transduction histidine kinase/HAMP domain-containing protein